MRGRVSLRGLAALALAGVLGSCGGGGGGTQRAAGTASRHRIASSTTAPTPEAAAAAEQARVAAIQRVVAASRDLTPEQRSRLEKCGVPPSGSAFGSYPGVPGREDNPFGEPDNDFPVKAVLKPTKFRRGDTVHLDVVATSGRKTVIVVLASFFDDTHHGVRAAKFADAAGKVSFDLDIPADVPLGVGRFVVSASTEDDKSAVADPKFTVTGPGCE